MSQRRWYIDPVNAGVRLTLESAGRDLSTTLRPSDPNKLLKILNQRTDIREA